jgi:hypothetical protein
LFDVFIQSLDDLPPNLAQVSSLLVYQVGNVQDLQKAPDPFDVLAATDQQKAVGHLPMVSEAQRISRLLQIKPDNA